MVRLSGVFKVTIVDYTEDKKMPFAMPATKCDDKMRKLVSANVRRLTNGKNQDLVFHEYRFGSFIGQLFGLGKSVKVQLVDFKTSWDKNGIMSWSFVWDVPVEKRDLDLAKVKNQIEGGISDGWGECTSQSDRFGPLVTHDEENKPVLVTTKTRTKEMNVGEHGRYATLITTVGAKLKILK